MRRICTLIIISTLMAAACTTENGPQQVLKQFYSQYLEVSCPPFGEYPDFDKEQQLLQQYMTPQLYDSWMKSYDSESVSWIDYDIFLGIFPPCLLRQTRLWLGLKSKLLAARFPPCSNRRTFALRQTATAVGCFSASLSAKSTGLCLHPDNIVNRSSVFFHLTRMDEAWHIDAVDDGFSRMGVANTGEEFTLLDSPEYQENKVLTNLIGE